jgi:hypothetical protein
VCDEVAVCFDCCDRVGEAIEEVLVAIIDEVLAEKVDEAFAEKVDEFLVEDLK